MDEVVIFDEGNTNNGEGENETSSAGEFTGIGHSRQKTQSSAASSSNSGEGGGRCNVQLARILQYLECPQYLRKSFFPKHHDLRLAGLLNPLDSPHHMRADDVSVTYREGAVLDRPTKPDRGSFADCGLAKPVQIDVKLDAGTRVTVAMERCHADDKYHRGRVVPPHQPRARDGLYWGYQVRLAPSLSTALSGCPYALGRYDLTIGTSERGDVVDDLTSLPAPLGVATRRTTFTHLLVVFGGVNGLELSMRNDAALADLGGDPSGLFDLYLNTLPGQGSRTIRTEEAILVTLAALRPKLETREQKE